MTSPDYPTVRLLRACDTLIKTPLGEARMRARREYEATNGGTGIPWRDYNDPASHGRARV